MNRHYSIAARPALYRGTVFRSTLEVRWAVYLDAVGLTWEYEPRCFDLEELGRYLPDFWLPQVRSWAEVKPGTFSDEERARVVSLCRTTHQTVLLLDGRPEPCSYELVCPCADGSDHELYHPESVSSEWVMVNDRQIREARFYFVYDEGRFLEESISPAMEDAISLSRFVNCDRR